LVYESFNEKGENSEMILSSKAYFGRGKLQQAEYEFKLVIRPTGIEQIWVEGKGHHLKAVRTFK
jgi:hypothetical protein